MSIMYNILLIYALAFIIGLFVSCIIWLLYTGMTTNGIKKTMLRDSYNEIKQLKQKK